jgi:hypothetical protein
MPNQKISELTAIVTVDNSVDVLPIVDISANTTKKVTPNALKTALALDNVNNTSDANKPVSIAQQDALNAKVDENAPITAGTAPKITFDAKGLVTSGDSLDETDLPTGINANKIGTGVVSTTEFEYLNGVTSAIQTQFAAKQDTLVSGTNIKTINGTSLVGSGDVTINTNASGVSGAIQFSDGSALASDAANLFWDDTNKRLGVGTNAPSATTHIKGSGSTSATTSLLVQNSAGTTALQVKDNGDVGNTPASGVSWLLNNVGLSLSSGGIIDVAGSGSSNTRLNAGASGNAAVGTTTNHAFSFLTNNSTKGQISPTGQWLIGAYSTSYNICANLEIRSTTQGVLFPRVTNTQKNAISTPLAGLLVFDTTLGKLSVHNGTAWETITSL